MTMQARRLYCGNLPFGITEVIFLKLTLKKLKLLKNLFYYWVIMFISNLFSLNQSFNPFQCREPGYHRGTGCPQIEWNRKRRQVIWKAQNETLIRIRSVVTTLQCWEKITNEMWGFWQGYGTERVKYIYIFRIWWLTFLTLKCVNLIFQDSLVTQYWHVKSI